MLRPSSCVLWMVMAGIVLSAAGGRVAAGHAEAPRLTVAEGASLEATLKAIHAAKPGVVAADVSSLSPTLKQAIDDQPLDPAALRTLSSDFDRHWVQRGRVLVLQRRFTNPKEEPGPELAELRVAGAAMHRLVSQSVRAVDYDTYRDSKKTLLASFTPEQMAQLSTPEGILLSRLPREQRQLWFQINDYKAYSDTLVQLRRAVLSLKEWEQLTARDISLAGDPRRQLSLEFRDPESAAGRDLVTFSFVFEPRASRSSRASSGVELPKLPGRPAPSLRAEWSLPVHTVDYSAPLSQDSFLCGLS